MKSSRKPKSKIVNVNKLRKEIKLLNTKKKAGYTKEKLKEFGGMSAKVSWKCERKREDNQKEIMEDSIIVKKKRKPEDNLDSLENPPKLKAIVPSSKLKNTNYSK